MDKPHHIVMFVLLVVFIAYVAVSTANKHLELDHEKLIQWRYENAVRP